MATIDIWPGKNLWRAPDWQSCFGIQLEGPSPTGDTLLEMRAIVSNRRRAWSPDREAWKQLQAVTNEAVRRHVLARIWDSIIVALAEDEAPFPIKAWCSAVETRANEEGLLQAYLCLEHPQPVPNGFGRDESARYLISGGEDGRFWINLVRCMPSRCWTSEPGDPVPLSDGQILLAALQTVFTGQLLYPALV